MADAAILTRPGTAIASLDALYAEADRLDVTPGWLRRERPILWPEPHSQFVPAHWSYHAIHDALEAEMSSVFPGETHATAKLNGFARRLYRCSSAE